MDLCIMSYPGCRYANKFPNIFHSPHPRYSEVCVFPYMPVRIYILSYVAVVNNLIIKTIFNYFQCGRVLNYNF